MNVEYINPFLTSALAFFRDYLGMQIENGMPYLEPEPENIGGISGIISLTGDVRGSIVLNFPRATAFEVAGAFAGISFRAVSKVFIDAVGEMVNIVAGSAKQHTESRIDISVPGVVVGDNYKLCWGQDIPVVAIPLGTPYGPLRILVSIKEGA